MLLAATERLATPTLDWSRSAAARPPRPVTGVPGSDSGGLGCAREGGAGGEEGDEDVAPAGREARATPARRRVEAGEMRLGIVGNFAVITSNSCHILSHFVTLFSLFETLESTVTN